MTARGDMTRLLEHLEQGLGVTPPKHPLTLPVEMNAIKDLEIAGRYDCRVIEPIRQLVHLGIDWQILEHFSGDKRKLPAVQVAAKVFDQCHELVDVDRILGVRFSLVPDHAVESTDTSGPDSLECMIIKRFARHPFVD